MPQIGPENKQTLSNQAGLENKFEHCQYQKEQYSHPIHLSTNRSARWSSPGVGQSVEHAINMQEAAGSCPFYFLTIHTEFSKLKSTKS